MPRYTPLLVDPRMTASHSSLIEFRWKDFAITADFTIPGDHAQALRVCFKRVEIVRILDEMPMSTEHEPTRDEGIVPDHFAYLVESAMFWDAQSEALKLSRPGLKHYRFFTFGECVDVLSASEPTISVIAIPTPIDRANEDAGRD